MHHEREKYRSTGKIKSRSLHYALDQTPENISLNLEAQHHGGRINKYEEQD